MPLCNLYLIHLAAALPDFLKQLDAWGDAIVVARVVRWIIRPTTIDVSGLLDHPWDLLVISRESLTQSILTRHYVNHLYHLQIGVPSSYKPVFPTPELTGALESPRFGNAQHLELSPELLEYMPKSSGPVSMLNLLAFKPNMHKEYLKYGKAFAEVGARRGGVAKIVGKVVDGVWDEVAVAYYPSLAHFADMIASEDYQEVNHRHRLGSLEDTCILMTSEIKRSRL